MKKETGLMFKAPLVRAILSGQKTQTRRIVKWKGLQKGLNLGFSGLRAGKTGDNWVLESNTPTSSEWRCTPTPCPFGKPGDRIYVRETYFAWGRWETRFSQEKGRDEWHFVDLTLQSGRSHEFYDPLLGKLRRRGQTGPGATWWKRPGILMPKPAARIWLEIAGVRVERLQEITEGDAEREGVQLKDGSDEPYSETNRDGFRYRNYQSKEGAFDCSSARESFRSLWKSTGGDWDANPWVWVIGFKTISTTGRPA